ncbi:uncharacterized protein ppp1r3aa [Stigmatopora nigra]
MCPIYRLGPGLSCNPTPSVQSRPLSLSRVPGGQAQGSELRGRQLSPGPSRTMEALSVQLLKEERVSSEEDTRTEAFCPWGPGEPVWEPPAAVRRKVSFADAFGLDLVSVKEYDEVNAAGDGLTAERDAPLAANEEFYLSCLFTAPSSEEELERRLELQMVELEKVELLPGTSTFRGMVRVRNLCFGKSVYARITLDCWKSYFDLLADYIPGSSDRKTDGFTFQYTVVPPLDKEGCRVEFCLCYETSAAGTFWDNNQGMNYVMFCHQKCVVQQQVQEENGGLKMKRSCLRANRRASTQEKKGTDTLTLVAGLEVPRDADGAKEESPPLFDSAKPLVASFKSRKRAERLAHVKEIFSQQASWRDLAGTIPPLGGEILLKRQRKQVLSYHQIPLIPLDWDNDKKQQWVSSKVDKIWTGRTTKAKENVMSVDDIWGSFLQTKSPTLDTESSVCDVWQAFINGPGSNDKGNVPESEWLQTAASVPPLSDNWNARLATSAASAVGQALSRAFPSHVSSNADTPESATRRECTGGSPLMSRGSVDSSSECQWREEEQIKVENAHIADVATTPRDLTTTDTTAKAQNAGQESDKISHGESQKWEDMGVEYNTMNDTVAFGDEGTTDRITVNCATKEEIANKTSTMRDSENQDGQKDGSVDLDKKQLSSKTGQNPTSDNIVMSVEHWKQPEPSEKGQSMVNWKYNVQSKNFLSENIETIDSRILQDDLVRRRSTTDALGSDQISLKEGEVTTHGQSTRSNSFVWWGMLYILSHITRIVTYGLIFTGFFFVVVLYDFPAIVVIYVFSMAWWFYKWFDPVVGKQHTRQ